MYSFAGGAYLDMLLCGRPTVLGAAWKVPSGEYCNWLDCCRRYEESDCTDPGPGTKGGSPECENPGWGVKLPPVG